MSNTPLQLAEKNTILRVLVGSQAYGISEGVASDRDEKAVFIEPFEYFVGFNQIDNVEYRSATERTGQKDAPSGPDDLDLVIYGLQKFLRLALKGNPSIIEMFFVKNLIKCDVLGEKLRELYPYIVSKRAGRAYLGYMQAQRRKLTDKVSEPDTERAKLVERFGFHTKYAGHLIRLGMQGVELLTTGKLVLPMNTMEATLVKTIRNGSLPLDMVLESADDLEVQIKYLLDNSDTVPEEPNTAYMEDWMINTYWGYWKAQRFMLDLPINSGVH